MTQHRIFVSYSHLGNGPKWKAALLRALQVFESQHLLDVWEDGKIRVSSFWDDDIAQAMTSAQLAVILLTDEALTSEYILTKELPRLRQRQQREKLPVFPVICEPCDWKAHDWLRATQAPNESNPLSELPDDKIDRIFRRLANDIAENLSRVALANIAGTDAASEPPRLYLDKFPLTRSSGQRKEKLIGREQELALLDLAFAQPHTAIVSLVAWGGVGKTMLVQHWLQRLEREGWFGASRVYAWSFYSQGTTEDRQASEDLFLAHALEWFGVKCEPTLSPWDKGRLLAEAVSRQHTLLILDGIEPLQYPPGPMGGQLRAPGVQSLLKQLARKSSALNSHSSTLNQSLCLVTTREPLTDLTDFQRRPDAAWGSVLRVDLGNLTEEAGAALLHHAGAKRAGAAEIKADDTELLAASREVDGHALTLNLLARFLARAHGGDIRRRELVKFEEADRREKGGTTFKMLSAFENWFGKSGESGARQLAVLRILGLFDRPADAACIAALRKPPRINAITRALLVPRFRFLGFPVGARSIADEDWNTAVSFLTDCGLLRTEGDIEAGELVFDCHPLIREYFANQLRGKAPRSWRSAHHRLYIHLCKNAVDLREPNLKDLEPLYLAVMHGCEAMLHQRVFNEVLSTRIDQGQKHYSVHRLGAYASTLASLSCFFEHHWTHVSPALAKGWHAWMLHGAAYCLGCLGRISEAVRPTLVSMEMDVRSNKWKGAAISANNLSEFELVLGQVRDSIDHATQAIEYADRGNDGHWMISTRTALGNALHAAGNSSSALAEYVKAESALAHGHPGIYLHNVSGFRYCDLLLADVERAASRIQLGFGPQIGMSKSCGEVNFRGTYALRLTTEGSRDVLGIALSHLTLNRAILFQQVEQRRFNSTVKPRRSSHLDQTVDYLRLAGQQCFIPSGLISRAWWRLLNQDAAGGRADLDEAWDIASRGPMRLHLADIHLYRARLFFREKQYPWKSPQEDLAAAEKLINDCGYHRRDEELADAKRAILTE